MITSTRFKMIAGAFALIIVFQFMIESGTHSTLNSTGWISSSLVARKNSRMDVIQRGDGALVRMNRKIIIETDKSPVSGIISVHKFGFILGKDEPDFLKQHAESLVGLREGAIARIPGKVTDLKFKVLKVCHDKLPDSSKCEIPPIDKAQATKLDSCLEPSDLLCQKTIAQLIMRGSVEEPELILIEYCVVESEYMCLKMIEAIALATFSHPDFAGRFNPVAEGSALYLSQSSQIKLEEIVLSKGSLEFASYLLGPNPQELKPEIIASRFKAAEKNPPVYQKMIQEYLGIISQNAYNADKLILRLQESGVDLPWDLKRAIEIKQSR